jgi:hypothetical protein
LEKLQLTESAAWAEEEAVIESQGVDVLPRPAPRDLRALPRLRSRISGARG